MIFTTVKLSMFPLLSQEMSTKFSTKGSVGFINAMTQYSQEDLFILAIRRSGNHAIANWLIPFFQE